MVTAPATTLPQLDETSIDPRLSLGMELEFFLAFRPGHFANPDYSHTEQALLAVGDALHRFHVPVINVREALSCATDHNYSTWSVDTDDHELSPPEAAALPNGFAAAPVEVISRAFQYKRRSFRHEIERAITAIRSLEGPDCAAITTAATGLHVHIGLGIHPRHTPPWSLPAVRNLLSFLLACEPALDQLHSAKRIGHSASSLCCPLSLFFLEREHHHASTSTSPPPPLRGIRAWLREIQAVDSLEHITRLFVRHSPANQTGRDAEEYNHNSAYNLEHLASSNHAAAPSSEAAGGKNTIEFRQHAGTLDAPAALAWIELLAALTSWFTCSPESGVFVRRRLLGPGCHRFDDIDLERIFALVGLRRDVAAYYLAKVGTGDDACLWVVEARCARFKQGVLSGFVRRVEMGEVRCGRPRAVAGVIAEKFERGMYGY